MQPDIRAFIEQFYEQISWAGGKAEAEEFLCQLYELPDALRQFLKDNFYIKKIFSKPSDLDIFRQFVTSRCYQHLDRVVLFSVVELVNHHPKGHLYQSSSDGISLEGESKSEILASYSVDDAWRRFLTYGFPCRERYAFSDFYKINPQDGSHSINVGVEAASPELNDIKSMVPVVKRTGSDVTISHLLLGDRGDPMIPVNNFRNHVKPWLGAGSEEFFEMLSYMNKMKFWKLHDLCNRHHGPMVSKLKLACQFQLEALDYAWFGSWVPTESS